MPDGYRSITEMCVSSRKHLSVCIVFNQGSLFLHKTKKPFSAIALDHAHEQVNSVVKGEGGAVALTESSAALSR